MKRSFAFLQAACIGVLVTSLCFGAGTEVRKWGEYDLSWGPYGTTWTSPSGKTVRYIPRFFSTDAFTDNLTLYGKGVTGDNTGRLKDMSIGSASYTDNGYLNYLIANYMYDNQVINITDPRYGAVNGADSTAAIIAAVAAASPGDTIFIPRGEFWTTSEISLAGKSHLTIAGSNMQNSRISLASGVSGTRSVFSLLGASYITMRDLELYSATNGANSPKAILILGRTSSGSFGGHRFDRISARGYATQTAIYSIASEENSWTNVWAELDGGGGKYVFYTSGADDLGLTGFTSSTNLSMWFSHFRFLNASSVDNAATIYIKAAPSNGDIVFRDGFLSSVKGSHIELSAYTGGGAGNYTFSNIRAENGGVNPTYGIKFTSSGGTSISRIRVEDCNFDSATYFMYADDNMNIVNSIFSNNQHTVTDNSVTSSFYTGSYLTFLENYSHITFRNTINGGHVVMMNPGYTFDGGTNPQYTIQDNYGRYRNIKQSLPTGATPSVQYGNMYHTANGGATTITNLTNGSLSQEVVIVCQDNVTSMTDNTTAGLTLNGNFSCTTVGDTIRLINDGTAWRELSRSVN